MGNCISKINKDHFFAFEEEIKNDILFFLKARQGLALTCLWGNIYGIPYYREVFRNNDFGPITNWVVVEKSLKQAASNKIDRLYQRTSNKHIHWSNRVWKDPTCFRVD